MRHQPLSVTHPLVMKALETVTMIARNPLVWRSTRMPINTNDISCRAFIWRYRKEKQKKRGHAEGTKLRTCASNPAATLTLPENASRAKTGRNMKSTEERWGRNMRRSSCKTGTEATIRYQRQDHTAINAIHEDNPSSIYLAPSFGIHVDHEMSSEGKTYQPRCGVISGSSTPSSFDSAPAVSVGGPQYLHPGFP